MKIQLKRSNQRDGGVAKKPSADQMEYGELAVNYNFADPTIFLKDSNNQIVAIQINKIGSIDSGSNPPSVGNNVGDLFFDVSNNQLLFWNGSSWVPLNTNLGYIPAPTKGTVTNSSGNDADIPLADSVYAGLLAPDQYSKLLDLVGVVLDSPSNGLKLVDGKLSANIASTSSLGTVKVGEGLQISPEGKLDVTIEQDFLTSVDLTYEAEPSYGLIKNTGGTDATIPLADTVKSGLMAPESVQFLGELSGKNILESVNLEYLKNGDGDGVVTNSGGTGFNVPIATSTYAGLMTSSEKQKLASLTPGGGGGDGLQFVNLRYSEASDRGTIENTGGDNAVIPLVNSLRAGLMSPQQNSKLDALPTTFPTVNDGELGFLNQAGQLVGTFSANQAGNSSVVLAPVSANTINSLQPLLAIASGEPTYSVSGLVSNVELPDVQSFSMPVPPEANAFYTVSTYFAIHYPNPDADYGVTDLTVSRLYINPYIQFSGRGATLFGSNNDRFGVSMGGTLCHRPTAEQKGDEKFRNYYWATRTDFFTCTPGSGEITFSFRTRLEEANSSKIRYNASSRLQIIPMVV